MRLACALLVLAAPLSSCQDALGHRGTVLKDERGRWHMWSAEMTGGCPERCWAANSQIVHATSKDGGYTFTKDAVVWPSFAHEPTVVRGPEGVGNVLDGRRGGVSAAPAVHDVPGRAVTLPDDVPHVGWGEWAHVLVLGVQPNRPLVDPPAPV